ncbi:MAG TPA: peptide-methionine (S)-S-oxide reductase MsrA [Rhizomicrobium sp.]|nr:peptide-methionine (S)-S-oxide reductase MsrA [Rhizomicrobium sp.]
MNRLHRFRQRAMAVLLALGCLGATWLAVARADEPPHLVPAALLDTAKPGADMERAVLAGGCFWGIEGVFQHVKGVRSVVSGYSGGAQDTATYALVSTERTGHAEAVRITFDPQVISYGQILRIYFSVAHDPTQLNRQGPDRGPSYRSNIFTVSDEQGRIAKAYIAQLENAHVFAKPIVTRVDPLKRFYAAESYHQNFLQRHPTNSYIVVNDLPKIANLKRLLPEMYRAQPISDVQAR